MTLVEPKGQNKKKTVGVTKLCNREVDSTYCNQLLVFNELLFVFVFSLFVYNIVFFISLVIT